jgi:hypothetical protein
LAAAARGERQKIAARETGARVPATAIAFHARA